MICCVVLLLLFVVVLVDIWIDECYNLVVGGCIELSNVVGKVIVCGWDCNDV